MERFKNEAWRDVVASGSCLRVRAVHLGVATTGFAFGVYKWVGSEEEEGAFCFVFFFFFPSERSGTILEIGGNFL